jgi:hypothetical protein
LTFTALARGFLGDWRNAAAPRFPLQITLRLRPPIGLVNHRLLFSGFLTVDSANGKDGTGPTPTTRNQFCAERSRSLILNLLAHLHFGGVQPIVGDVD